MLIASHTPPHIVKATQRHNYLIETYLKVFTDMMATSGMILALAALLPQLASAETVIGAFIFHRHGDRTAKAWNPVNLTALGADEVFTSGTYFRNRYVSSNASSPIHALSSDIAVLSQMSVTSPIDNVLQSSAQVFLQGLYPPAGSVSSQTLANGSSVEAPMGGYQYVPVQAVTNAATGGGAESNEWLQASSGCGNAVASSNNYFFSAEYMSTLNSTKDFYQSLDPVISGTYSSAQASFKNAYTIYDLIHVATIHNSSIPSDSLLTTDTLHQLQTRADQHEWGLAYNASDSVRAIAGAVLAAQIVQGLNTTLAASASSRSAQRLTIQFGAYGTFMSFFGLAGLPAASPNFYGIVDYASAFVIELVSNATVPSAGSKWNASDVSVRFLFVNGTVGPDNQLATYPLFGQKETLLGWNAFTDGMNAFAIGNTSAWCQACGNSTGVCAPADSSSGSSASGDAGNATATSNDSDASGVSRPVAGVIGALVTLVVILGIEALVMGAAGLRLVRKRSAGEKAATGAGSPTA
jgi:hypothetical protein